ncbi:hypothetical protein PPROV_000608200 [Pycnococcus provasolii]|uniref:NAD-dependent epimerase/dehydratase domain-containing protein n=2 Tax=Pycnococcus provasolii TaxID=41880 RepID=A0A830HPH0_9CHLO|nr:hypothetical protein PPROV_000608200 [Pycnococcus provasolii]|mmetsp:Transcript_5286/g.13710  ORF Transcript_5286/g.13710 Transcript_5286/m.13710 type:complete len:417 (-) Transcript_5286:35-1285(-)
MMMASTNSQSTLKWWQISAFVAWILLAMHILYHNGGHEPAAPKNMPPEVGGTIASLNNEHRDMNGHEPTHGQHVVVTGGAGFIGSHMTMHLLEHGYAVTILDNLSRGNAGAVRVLREHATKRGRLRFEFVELEDETAVRRILRDARNRGTPVDVVMHFAAIAFVGESVAYPLNYWTNITSNTITLLRAMKHENVNKLVYSSTCATYGNPVSMPITEDTPTVPINPYGRAKLDAEDAIRDYAHANKNFDAVILRYFNVYGADPKGRLGEYPPPNLVGHGRVSTACFAAAFGHIPELKIYGTDFSTGDGTCVRDYIHVTDLVEAHHLAMAKALSNPPSLYNIGTGVGVSVREFTRACLSVTRRNITVVEHPRRPGDYAEVYASPAKIKDELGWEARYRDVEEGLATAWRWRERHENGY